MKKLIITLVVIAAIAASVGGYYYTRPGPEPKITTAAVTRGDVIESVGATGTFEAVTSVTVGSQVSGTIQEWTADFNSIVKKGQVIARIDPSLLQTQLEQSQANLVRAQADVERLKVSVEDAKAKLVRADGLFKRQLLTQADLETAQVNVKSTDAQLKSSQAALTQAQASVNQNQVNLEHTIITAPIDGIVVSRNIDVGQTVAASFNAPTLFIIAADLTKMKCTANIDESDVGRIRTGQRVRFRVDAYPTEKFTGTVAQVRLQPVVVQNVVTYGTVIEVPNPEFKLKPGMTANVTIEIVEEERRRSHPERGRPLPADRRRSSRPSTSRCPPSCSAGRAAAVSGWRVARAWAAAEATRRRRVLRPPARRQRQVRLAATAARRRASRARRRRRLRKAARGAASARRVRTHRPRLRRRRVRQRRAAPAWPAGRSSAAAATGRKARAWARAGTRRDAASARADPGAAADSIRTTRSAARA